MYSFMKLKMCSLLYFRTKQVVPSWKSNWRVRKSNPRPSACKADALPTELTPLSDHRKVYQHSRRPQYDSVLVVR